MRTLAQMNPADARSLDGNLSPVSGSGNAIPMIGTGNIIYSQLGYLLRRDLLGEGHGQVQPYATFYHGKFHLLNDPINVYGGELLNKRSQSQSYLRLPETALL
jgi:hypothetical protein